MATITQPPYLDDPALFALKELGLDARPVVLEVYHAREERAYLYYGAIADKGVTVEEGVNGFDLEVERLKVQLVAPEGFLGQPNPRALRQFLDLAEAPVRLRVGDVTRDGAVNFSGGLRFDHAKKLWTITIQLAADDLFYFLLDREYEYADVAAIEKTLQARRLHDGDPSVVYDVNAWGLRDLWDALVADRNGAYGGFLTISENMNRPPFTVERLYDDAGTVKEIALPRQPYVAYPARNVSVDGDTTIYGPGGMPWNMAQVWDFVCKWNGYRWRARLVGFPDLQVHVEVFDDLYRFDPLPAVDALVVYEDGQDHNEETDEPMLADFGVHTENDTFPLLRPPYQAPPAEAIYYADRPRYEGGKGQNEDMLDVELALPYVHLDAVITGHVPDAVDHPAFQEDLDVGLPVWDESDTGPFLLDLHYDGAAWKAVHKRIITAAGGEEYGANWAKVAAGNYEVSRAVVDVFGVLIRMVDPLAYDGGPAFPEAGRIERGVSFLGYPCLVVEQTRDPVTGLTEMGLAAPRVPARPKVNLAPVAGMRVLVGWAVVVYASDLGLGTWRVSVWVEYLPPSGDQVAAEQVQVQYLQSFPTPEWVDAGTFDAPANYLTVTFPGATWILPTMRLRSLANGGLDAGQWRTFNTQRP